MENLNNNKTVEIGQADDGYSSVLAQIAFFCLLGIVWYAAKCFQNPNSKSNVQESSNYKGDDLEYMQDQWKAYEEHKKKQKNSQKQKDE